MNKIVWNRVPRMCGHQDDVEKVRFTLCNIGLSPILIMKSSACKDLNNCTFWVKIRCF